MSASRTSVPRLSFFFTAPAPTAIYTLSLHDALPIYRILAALDPLEHLAELEVGEVAGLDLLPGARGRHRGPQPAAQRVRAHGGLAAVVLRPVHQHQIGRASCRERG